MDWTYLALFHCFILLKLIQAQSCPGTQTATGCYVIREDQQTWSGAKTECQNIASTMKRPGFGYLASITDDTQYKVVKGLVNDLIKTQGTFSAIDNLRKMWIGGYEESTARGDVPMPNWRWVDETLERMFYQGCFVEDPSSPEFSYSKVFTGVMSPQLCIDHCYTKGYTIAATRKGDTCSCGNSYKAKSGTSNDCNSNCLGGYELCGGPSSNQIYIINGSYSEWNYNQPNNFDNYQACGHIELQHVQSNIFVMGDKFCRENHAYACSVAQSKCDNREAFTATAGNKCVYYEIYRKVNWFKAREECVAKGGDLMTVTSKEMMTDMTTFLVQTLRMTQPLWIGMYGRKWMWDDNKKFTFSDFPSSHPINKDYNCLRLVSNQQGTYTWEDHDCSKSLSFLCLIDTVTPLPTTTTKPTTTTVTTTKATIKTSILTTKSRAPITIKMSSTANGAIEASTSPTISSGTDNGSTTVNSVGDLSTISPKDNTTDPQTGASTSGMGDNMIYILIGAIGGVLLLSVVIGLVFYKVKKNQSEFTTSHVHPDKEAQVPYIRPPDTDRNTLSRRGMDEASTITTSNIRATMDPLPDLTRGNGRVHESRFKLEPIQQQTGEEKRKKEKKQKKKKERESRDEGEEGTEKRHRKKKSKRASMETEEVRSSLYENAVVDMSLKEYNY